ncbi:O-antigen polymerase [Aeromonas veronii]|uniref:O-antigen polymerase n=1 Tax=Aeromonas veronii TaxID=654 RepID=UPI002B4A6289|nr:O-antigen polymerase [Aeromonas veronii]
MKMKFGIRGVTLNWNFCWASLAFANISGAGEISIALYIYILTFLFFFMLAYSFIYNRLAISNHYVTKYHINEMAVKYFSLIMVLICVLYSFKAYNMMMSMPIWEYRAKAFGDSSEASVLFGSQVFRIIYSIFVEGGIYFLQFYFLAKYYLTSNVRYVLFGGFFILTMSFIMLGRSPIYYYFLLFSFLFLNLNKSSLGKYLLILLSGFCILYGATFFRAGGQLDIISFIYKYLVGYHTYGFNLLERGVNFTSLNSLWFGQATLGSFSYFLLYPIEKVFDIGLLYFNSDAYVMKQEFVVLSSGDEANAFYTIFYDMYQDFYLLGTVVYGLIFGGIYAYFQKKMDLDCHNIYTVMCYLLCLNISFGMIFRNPLATNGFVGMFIYMFIFLIISNIKYKSFRV